jgi:heme a synthase
MERNTAFYKIALSTLVAVYLLIGVGGVVRSTGSGMGCPDWPKCFGSWVPPTSVDQLPENYREKYAEYRLKKNERFAKYLNAINLNETATKILEDESIREEAEFNVVKTWIEYVNLVIGVIIGFLIFLTFVSSLRFWKSRRSMTIIAFLTFILVAFQGWLGSIVVSTNLTPWTITVHMLVALVIVALLMYLVFRARPYWAPIEIPGIHVWVIGCIVVLAIQIVLGTQVREALDRVADSQITRENWIMELGQPFIWHRTFSWIVLILHVGLVLKLRKSGSENRFLLSVILLILGTVLTGVGMAWFAVPPYLQPLHLLLATVTIGVQFLLMLRVNTRETEHVISKQ